MQNILEHCNNKLSLYTIFKLAEQMLRLIQSVHQEGFIHCDIKPENFVIDKNNTVHLINFGFSKRFRNKKTGEHIHFKERKNL
jgi:casein kinase 1